MNIETLSDTLFDIPESVPKWRELADNLGITAKHNDQSGTWSAEIGWFREIEHESGETEREATVALIHRLKLTGWQEVSV